MKALHVYPETRLRHPGATAAQVAAYHAVHARAVVEALAAELVEEAPGLLDLLRQPSWWRD